MSELIIFVGLGASAIAYMMLIAHLAKRRIPILGIAFVIGVTIGAAISIF